MVLLIGAPALISDPGARHFLEQAQYLGGVMAARSRRSTQRRMVLPCRTTGWMTPSSNCGALQHRFFSCSVAIPAIPSNASARPPKSRSSQR